SRVSTNRLEKKPIAVRPAHVSSSELGRCLKIGDAEDSTSANSAASSAVPLHVAAAGREGNRRRQMYRCSSASTPPATRGNDDRRAMRRARSVWTLRRGAQLLYREAFLQQCVAQPLRMCAAA